MDIEKYINDLPNRVWGETEADRVRHSQARSFFLNRMTLHTGNLKLFRAWDHACGVYQPALDLRRATIQFKLLKSSSAPTVELGKAHEICNECIIPFAHAVSAAIPSMIVPLAQTYVNRELGMTWEWLVLEIGRMWLASLHGWAADQPVTLTFQYTPADPPKATDDYHFESRPDETSAASFARFQAETREFRKKRRESLKEQTDNFTRAHPKGRLRADQDVERSVEWFFRLRVIKESVRHISMFGADGKKLGVPHERKDVKHYAEVAERWLSFGYTRGNLEKSLRDLANNVGIDPPPGEVAVENNEQTSPLPQRPKKL